MRSCKTFYGCHELMLSIRFPGIFAAIEVNKKIGGKDRWSKVARAIRRH